MRNTTIWNSLICNDMNWYGIVKSYYISDIACQGVILGAFCYSLFVLTWYGAIWYDDVLASRQSQLFITSDASRVYIWNISTTGTIDFPKMKQWDVPKLSCIHSFILLLRNSTVSHVQKHYQNMSFIVTFAISRFIILRTRSTDYLRHAWWE